MVQALEEEAPENPPKRPPIPQKTFSNGHGLEQLVTKDSRSIFCQLTLNHTFLLQDPTSWKTDQHYTMAHSVLGHLSVVNDRAERSVALIQDLNKKLTQEDDQLQFLVQVVADYRKKFQMSTKENLSQIKKF